MKRLLLGLLLLPLSALADIPPPSGYVEQCTVKKQCKKGEEGTTCGAYHGERDRCTKKLEPEGWQLRCRTRGASVWTEIYCRPKKK